MELREFYQRKEEISDRVRQVSEELSTALRHPEIVPDAVLKEWLGFNYIRLIDFTHDGKPMIGEVGGKIYKNGGGRVLATSDKSLRRLEESIGNLRRASRQNGLVVTALMEKIRKTEMVQSLRRALDESGFSLRMEVPEVTPYEHEINEAKRRYSIQTSQRNGFMVLDGNNKTKGYDFVSVVGLEDPLEMITINAGHLVNDGKEEQYIFNVPFSHDMIDALRINKDGNSRVHYLREVQMVPEGFIAGFHMALIDNEVHISPLIGESEADRQELARYADSGIRYVGRFHRSGKEETHTIDHTFFS